MCYMVLPCSTPRTPRPVPPRPRSPNGSARAGHARADHANADHPCAYRRAAAHRAYSARLRPPSCRDRAASLRQHRLQCRRCLLRHRAAGCDPRAPATRHSAGHRAGTRIARARGARPGYRLRRTGARAPTGGTSADLPAGVADSQSPPSTASAGQPAAAQVGKAARRSRPPGWNDPELFMPTLEELEAQVRRRPLGRTLVESVSTWRWCRASVPVLSGTSCSTASEGTAAASPP